MYGNFGFISWRNFDKYLKPKGENIYLFRKRSEIKMYKNI